MQRLDDPPQITHPSRAHWRFVGWVYLVGCVLLLLFWAIATEG